MADPYPEAQENSAIPDWQKRILQERLADIELHPDDEQSWEDVKAELFPRP